MNKCKRECSFASKKAKPTVRASLFRKIMDFLEQHPSRLFARVEIQILLLATGKAFSQKGMWILFSGDPLSEYAEYTKHCMKTGGDRKQLYGVMKRLGRSIRKITGLTEASDLQRLVFLLYSNIGITMTGTIPGEVLVSACFFSRVYTAKQCRFISGMDAGIIAGICGVGNMAFTERITEGCDACRACVPEKQRR